MMRKIAWKDLMSLLLLLLMCVVFGIMSRGILFSTYNVKNLTEQSMQVIIGALGVIYVIAMGSTDLSVGGNAAVSATIACVLSEKFGFWIFVPACLLIGLTVGLLNGLIVSKCKVSSFMCTLAMLIALRGLLNVFTTDAVVLAPARLQALNRFPVKVAIVIAFILILGYVFEFTRFGYYCKAMGENEQMAIRMGIDAVKIRIGGFLLSGLMASFVGIFQLIQQGGSSSTMGSFMEMKVMMAVFLGGVMVTGGLGTKIYKMIIGAFMISLIVNGLYLGNVSTDYLNAVEGIMLMLVLYMTLRIQRGRAAARP